jgi:hypothetical protein
VSGFLAEDLLNFGGCQAASACLGLFRYVSGCCGMSRSNLARAAHLVCRIFAKSGGGSAFQPKRNLRCSSFRMSSLFRGYSDVSGCVGMVRGTLESQCVMEASLGGSHTHTIPRLAEACGTSRKVAPARQFQWRFLSSATAKPPVCLFCCSPPVSAAVSGRCGVSRSGLAHAANLVCHGGWVASSRKLAPASVSSRTLGKLAKACRSSPRARPKLAGSSSEARRKLARSSLEALRKLFGSSAEGRRKLAGRAQSARGSSGKLAKLGQARGRLRELAA